MGGKPRDLSRRPHFPSLYAMIYPMMRETAMENGYCLAVHGSLARDLDVVAIPWTHNAVTAEALAERLAEVVNVFEPMADKPTEKPHGRLAWAFQLTGVGGYVDLSIMPLKGESVD